MHSYPSLALLHTLHTHLNLICLSFLHTTCVVSMEPIYSSKRKKLVLHSEIHPSTCGPHLVTSSAKAKYRLMRHCLTPVIGITFCSFSDLLEHIKNIGYDCLIVFTDKHIYI